MRTSEKLLFSLHILGIYQQITIYLMKFSYLCDYSGDGIQCVSAFFVGEIGHSCFKLSPLKVIAVLSNCADLSSYKIYKNVSLLIL